MNKSLEFYNQFYFKLINDYILGNQRIENAIQFLASFIPEKTRHILDIGCGIGWSTHEFANFFPDSEVEGVDLSPVLINKAERLFNRRNLSYKVTDITENVSSKKYDVIVMIDVYEHIPKKKREQFHISLMQSLNDNGRLILACPSKFHQDWLKNNEPKGLQPVDEDINFEVICNLAMDISGEVIFFKYNKIWKNYDYLYAVIEKNPLYGVDQEIQRKGKNVLEEKSSRIVRVNSKLGYNFLNSDKRNKKDIWKFILSKFKYLNFKKVMSIIKTK